MWGCLRARRAAWSSVCVRTGGFFRHCAGTSGALFIVEYRRGSAPPCDARVIPCVLATPAAFMDGSATTRPSAPASANESASASLTPGPNDRNGAVRSATCPDLLCLSWSASDEPRSPGEYSVPSGIAEFSSYAVDSGCHIPGIPFLTLMPAPVLPRGNCRPNVSNVGGTCPSSYPPARTSGGCTADKGLASLSAAYASCAWNADTWGFRVSNC